MALKTARTNAELNGFTHITFTRANAFDLLRERSGSGERYDTVILDPPAFAKTRRDLPRAQRAYKEINLRAMKLLNPGGILVTCSCPYHFSRELMEDSLRSAAAEAGRTMRVRERRGQAQDHPEILTIPRDPLPQVRRVGAPALTRLNAERYCVRSNTNGQQPGSPHT